MTVDPESGKSVEQFLQTKVDPTSGKTSQILLPLSSGTVDSQHGESNSFLLTLIVLTCMTIKFAFQAMVHLKSLKQLTHLQGKLSSKLYKIKLTHRQEKQCKPSSQFPPPM